MRLLDFDQFSGTATYHDYDSTTGQSILRTVQDLTPSLEHNKTCQTDGTGGYWDKERVFQRVAHIPTGVMMKWLVEDGVNVLNKDHWPAVLRKLNDIDNLHLRTVRSNLAVRPHD